MVTEAVLREGLATLADALPAGRPIEGPALRLWAVILRDVTDADFRRAVVEHCSRPGKTFMPSPGEILEAAFGNEQDHAQQLWLVVDAAVRRHGRYASVTFHPAANAAIRSMGGWLKLCETLEAELHFRRTEFLATTRSLLRNPPGEPEGAHLPGLEERDHVAKLGAWSGQVRLCGPGAVEPPTRVALLPERTERLLRVVGGISETIEEEDLI